jgi:hypothetical protein
VITVTLPHVRLDILIFVEDPGAANFAAPLPEALAKRGFRVLLLAAGTARACLEGRGVPCMAFDASLSPRAFLERTRPRLVVVGSAEDPRTVGLDFIALARRARVVSVGMVDAFMNAAHRFRGTGGAPLAYAPDWLLIPDGATCRAFVHLGYPEGRMVVCGHPHLDYVRATARRLAAVDRKALRARLFPGLARTQRALVFAAEISTGLNPDQYRATSEYTLQGRSGRGGRTDVVIEELLEAVDALPVRPYVVLRLHPKNREEEFGSYRSRLERLDRSSSPLDLVYAADLVVGMTSMLLQEAALLGTRTLSIIPRPAERDWLPAESPLVDHCVSTREELQQVLPALLLDAPRRNQTTPTLPQDEALGQVVDFLATRLRGTGTSGSRQRPANT